MPEEIANSGTSSHRIENLSYDAIKAIVKHSRVDKRERMVRSIPAIKKIDERMPYEFSRVTYSSNFFEIVIGKTSRTWYIQPPGNGRRRFDPEDEPDPEALTRCTIHFTTHKYSFEHIIEKPYKVALSKVMKEYLRKGTSIEKLHVFNCAPKELDLENINLKVSNISMERPTTELFHSWLKAMDDSHPLESIKFIVGSGSNFMFKEPLVQSCKRLRLQFPYNEDNPLDDWFFDLQTQQIEVIHMNFSHEYEEKLLRKWVNYCRPLGTSFSLGVTHFTDIMDVFDLAADWFKQSVPSKLPNITTGARHCVTIPIDEQLELVVFGEARAEQEQWAPFQWNLRFEVMKTGTTAPKSIEK